jgi:hypothetical protein
MFTHHQIDELLPVTNYNSRGYIGWTRNDRPYIKFASNGKVFVRFIKRKSLEEALKIYLAAYGRFTRDICKVALNNDGGIRIDYPSGFDSIFAPTLINLLIQYNVVSQHLNEYSFREVPEMIIIRTNVPDEPTSRYSVKGCDCPSGRGEDRLCVHAIAVHLKYGESLEHYFDWKLTTVKKKDTPVTYAPKVPKEYLLLYEELDKAAKKYKTDLKELTWKPGFFVNIWQNNELIGAIQHNWLRELRAQPKGQKAQGAKTIDEAMNLIVTNGTTAYTGRADRGDKVFIKSDRLPTIHAKTGIVTSRVQGGVMVNVPGWRVEFFKYSEIGIATPCTPAS